MPDQSASGLWSESSEMSQEPSSARDAAEPVGRKRFSIISQYLTRFLFVYLRCWGGGVPGVVAAAARPQRGVVRQCRQGVRGRALGGGGGAAFDGGRGVAMAARRLMAVMV